MEEKKAQLKTINESSEQGILFLWCLRILVPCGGHRKFVEKDGFSSDEVLALLGMEEFDEQEIDKPAITKYLKLMLADAEKKKWKHHQVLTNNLSNILDRISLSPVETELLMFSILLHTESSLEDCSETLGSLDKSKLIRFLSIILGHPQRSISQALSMSGQLALSGLLKIDTNWSRGMKSKIDLRIL